MLNFSSAVADFRRARYRAALQEIMARLRGRSNELLSYEEVRHKLRAGTGLSRGLREIPLDNIVGSVGRYTDFTRNFLPRHDADEGRWARVKVGVTGLSGLPPIEVYQIGDVYFVLDGNHRVSVARELGSDQIQAYVTEVPTKVPLKPGVQPDDLILMAEYADFLEKTQLDRLRPDADLSVTEPGKYPQLLEHIEVHRYFMGIEQQREIPYSEAVTHWYDTVYMPVVRMIQEQGILYDFPNRTETDLYLWLSNRRGALSDELGWPVEPELAVADLADQFGSRGKKSVWRLGEKLLNAVTPAEFKPGPPTGQWRLNRLARRADDRLFTDILVPVSGEEIGWYALEQAIEVARREGGRLHGLHVLVDEVEMENPEVAKVGDRFKWRCGEVGVPGELTYKVGPVAQTIADHGRWTDLIVVNLAHPPAPQPFSKLTSGFRTLLRLSPRPVLVTPGVHAPLERALLAYDGSPKAGEALYVATYLAGRWRIPLTVVSVTEKDRQAADMLAPAQSYLEDHGIAANYVAQAGPVAEAITATAVGYNCDWLLMGGYGATPVVEVVIGSVLDQVLRQYLKPVLICR